MKTVTIPESEYEELKRLAHYFPRGGGAHINAGSEVDRLKHIIHDLDRRYYGALRERNAYQLALKTVNENHCGDVGRLLSANAPDEPRPRDKIS